MNANGQDARYLYFQLAPLLGQGVTLVLDRELGVVSVLLAEDHTPRMVAQQQFTPMEVRLVQPLLEMFPHYCPYEVLLAWFQHSSPVTEALIARYYTALHEAEADGTWDAHLRPVRNVLSRARLKVQDLAIDICAIVEVGYVLMPVRSGFTRRRR